MDTDSGKSNQAGEFDAFAGKYEEALDQGLSVTGESKTFFAEGRIRWLRGCLGRMAIHPETVLDFGCGTGGSVPFFFKYLGVNGVVGMDPSAESLAVAREEWSGREARFVQPSAHKPTGATDLAFCNGVFHHIIPEERAPALQLVFEELRPGGIFAFWENNPWNPATRWVMSRVPFDEDAQLVWPATARRLLRGAGFEVLRTDYLFIFPRALGFLRWAEPLACKVPFGGQYQVLCRKG